MEPDISHFLNASHVSKQVKSGNSTLTILQDINLSIKQGESLAILGASGSGKTTLLTLLAGLDLPTQGDIYLLHHPIKQLNEEQRAAIRLKYIGFIFQSFQLLPALTALENVMLPLELQLIKNKPAQQKALYWLQQLGLEKRIHHYPSQLSGGEQQRVAIARAFISQPKLILADEMTGNLDTETGEKVADILFDLNKSQQVTLILVTHDQQLSLRCDRRLMLKQGRLEAC